MKLYSHMLLHSLMHRVHSLMLRFHIIINFVEVDQK